MNVQLRIPHSTCIPCLQTPVTKTPSPPGKAARRDAEERKRLSKLAEDNSNNKKHQHRDDRNGDDAVRRHPVIAVLAIRSLGVFRTATTICGALSSTRQREVASNKKGIDLKEPVEHTA